MVLTIGPAVRGANGRRYLTIHTVGLLLGAWVMALATALIGAALRSAIVDAKDLIAPAAAVVLVLWAVRSAVGRGLPFPSSSWQVPATWRNTLPFEVTMFAYGFLLGMGFLTAIVSPLYWCLLAGSALSPSLAMNLIAWTLYATMRAASTWLGSYRRFEDPGPKGVPGPVAPPHWRAAHGISILALLLLAAWLVI